MARTKLLALTGGLLVIVLFATFWLAGSHSSVSAAAVTPAPAGGAGPLDGLTFSSRIGGADGTNPVDDLLVFRDGMFLSTECERRCDYPASPYYVRRDAGTLEFLSESRCPNKDATIVWRGIVRDGVIRGEAVWTVNRWYWTVQKTLRFEGRLSGQSS